MIAYASAGILLGFMASLACCPNSPFEALNAANILQERVTPDQTEAEQVLAFSQALNAMSSCELASLVNMVARTTWTEDDASTVQGVMSQIDELKAQQLTALSSDQPPTAEEIKQGFDGVGIPVTLDTAELIRQMLAGFADFKAGGGGTTSPAPLLPLPITLPFP